MDKQSETLLEEVTKAASLYKMGDSPEKAIYLISQIQFLLSPLKEHILTVRSYETAERNIDKLRNSLPKETPEELQGPA